MRDLWTELDIRWFRVVGCLEKWVWPWTLMRFRRNREAQWLMALNCIAANTHELTKQVKLLRQSMEYGQCEKQGATNREKLGALDPEWEARRERDAARAKEWRDEANR